MMTDKQIALQVNAYLRVRKASQMEYDELASWAAEALWTLENEHLTEEQITYYEILVGELEYMLESFVGGFPMDHHCDHA